MASTCGVATAKESAASDVRTRARDRFYIGMSGFLLLIVVGGFAPTFSLRALFQTGELPLYLHVHGAILTTWFALAFTQACLVFVGRTPWHRRLGVAALPLALAVIAASIVVLANFVPRHAGNSGDTPVAVLFFGDSAILIVFAVLVGSAVLARGRPDTHKRLMLLASLSIVGPALSRWSRFGFLAFAPPVARQLGVDQNDTVLLHDDERISAAAEDLVDVVFDVLDRLRRRKRRPRRRSTAGTGWRSAGSRLGSLLRCDGCSEGTGSQKY